MDCTERVYSNDYYDLIANNEDIRSLEDRSSFCIQEINGSYSVFYLEKKDLGSLSLNELRYYTIPNCYTILNQTALESSGITKVQNQKNLSLKGQGILIGFVDTGISYEVSSFRNTDGSSRIVGIWDQTINTSKHPNGFIYGTEYTKEDIDRALASDNPKEFVPSEDEIGHGTYMASIAAGSEDIPNDFIGAAPYADIAVVKLKQAKQFLRDFYLIREGAIAYQENDILAGIDYLKQLAFRRGQPLVLCIGLGTNQGDHGGGSRMEDYLDTISSYAAHAVCVAVGNEANSRHHYYGSIAKEGEVERVELNVTADMIGFPLELWARATEFYSVSVISPTGEVLPPVPMRVGSHQEYRFLLEKTGISIDYTLVGPRSKEQLVYMTFNRPVEGIWTVVVYADSISTGHYHMWLPISEFLEKDVYFLKSNPDVTLTVPSTAKLPMATGGYDADTGAGYLESGRGYSASGDIKPDYSAPAVNVYGQNNKGRFSTLTGTSAAAAISAGASALLLEWNLEYRDNVTVNSVEIRNQIVAGTKRRPGGIYPNREEGDYVNIVPS